MVNSFGSFHKFLKITTSVRLCLSYEPLKCDFITFKINIISIRKRIADMYVVKDVTCTRQSTNTRDMIKKIILHTIYRFNFTESNLCATAHFKSIVIYKDVL